jgi:hypothetical protein
MKYEVIAGGRRGGKTFAEFNRLVNLLESNQGLGVITTTAARDMLKRERPELAKILKTRLLIKP